MLRALYSSISGLRAHQTMMDVTANNIANVNTQGFKAGRAIFADALSQTVRGGGALDTDANGGHGTRPSRSSDRVRQRCVLSLGKWASVRADRPWPGGEARLGHLASMRGFFALR